MKKKNVLLLRSHSNFFEMIVQYIDKVLCNKFHHVHLGETCRKRIYHEPNISSENKLVLFTEKLDDSRDNQNDTLLHII